jgi:DUF1680 family protein
MPFDDSELYKIIEGASYSLISKPNPALDAYLDSLIAIIKIGQEPDGYLTTWFTIDPVHTPNQWTPPSKHRWEHEKENHELFNSGQLFESAAAHYWATGKRNFLDIAIKNADLLVATFGPGKMSVPPGHEIIETGLVKLYRITHNPKYLELAKFYLDIRGDSTTHKLYGDFSQDDIPVVKQVKPTGHAVRAMYLYAGMTDIATIYHDHAYLDAVNKIWENMTDCKMYLTGGIGSRRKGEAFGNNYELPNGTAYCETCAAIGSVLWNQRLFMLTGNSKYYDIIERALYNGLISGISLDGKHFFYLNPLEADGKDPFNWGFATRATWFNTSCCLTNLTRFVPSVPGLIYATQADSLYINLYMSNHASVLVNNRKVSISQQTAYPWNGDISITINPETKTTFTLKLRVPGWAQNKPVPGNLYAYLDKNPEKVVLLVNGKEAQADINKGYLEITREWNKGDQVELVLPMSVRRVIANENVQDDRDKVAFERGPLVYCAEEADNNDQILKASVSDNAILKMEEKTILTDKVNAIVSNMPGSKLTLVPYYIWSNRGVGKMKVWFQRTNQ